MAVMDRQLIIERNKWKFLKDAEDIFEHFKAVLVQIIKESILKEYHMVTTGMGQRGFSSLAAEVILARLMHISRKPLLPELKKVFTQLNRLVGHNALPEVMIQDLEEI